jgi:hypothetical protein
MIVFNNLASIVALSVMLASALSSAAPTPVPENAVDVLNTHQVDGIATVVFRREGLEPMTLAKLRGRAEEQSDPDDDYYYPAGPAGPHPQHAGGIISDIKDRVRYIQLKGSEC